MKENNHQYGRVILEKLCIKVTSIITNIQSAYSGEDQWCGAFYPPRTFISQRLPYKAPVKLNPHNG